MTTPSKSLRALRAGLLLVPFLVLASVSLVGPLPPVGAQDQPEKLELTTWVEDFSRIVQPLRNESARNLHVPQVSTDAWGPIWEDDAPLDEAWELDVIEDMVMEAFGETPFFAVATFNTTRLAITAPADIKEQVVGFLDRLRQLSLGQLRIRVTRLNLDLPQWQKLRRAFPDGSATADAFGSWLTTENVTPASTADRQMRNGERLRFEQIRARRYVADLDSQTAINAAAFVPQMRTMTTGHSLACQAWLVRNSSRVLVDIAGQTSREDRMRSLGVNGGGQIQLPAATVTDFNATLIAQPGRVYFVGAASGQADTCTAFAVSASVVRARPAQLPGEMRVPGLLSRRYDVWELCLPWRNTVSYRLGTGRDEPGVMIGDDYLDDDASPLYYDEVPEVLEQLCPDWQVAGARESHLQIVGGGYIEFVNQTTAHAALQRALDVLLAARPKPLLSNVTAYRLDAAAARTVAALQPGGDGNVSPGEIAAIEGAAMVFDAAVWHLEGQRAAVSLLGEAAYVSDASVQVQQDIEITDPVVSVYRTGFSLCVRADADTTTGGYDVRLDGEVGTAGDLAVAEPTYESRVELPQVATSDLGSRYAPGDAWSAQLVSAPGSDQVLVVLVRTRVAGN